MKFVGKKRIHRILSGILSVLMVLTNLETIPAMAAEADEIVSEVAEQVEANTSDLVVNPDKEGEDYSKGFEVWFNNDGATSIEAGQFGTYPVYAGDAMAAKTNKITVDGVDHYSVQGTVNPTLSSKNPNGAIPDTGAYLKVVAPADGTITVYGYKATGKPFYATKGATSSISDSNSFDNETNSYTVSVAKDEEWYFYSQGSKAQFIGVKFELPKASHDIPLSFAGEALGDTTITFTNTTTKVEVVVGASDTKVTLVESYVYSVKVNSASLTIDIDSVSLKDSIPESITITVAVAAKHEVSGSFKGLPDGAGVSSLSFKDEAGAETVATITGNTYTALLKNGTYTAVATTDVADYTVFDHVLVEGVSGEAISNDVWFYGAAPSYGTEYKAALKVGKAEGADYATISEAVAAAKAMTRSADQWVTLELIDEEYVEQVIVNTNNIKMVAAEGVTPEIRWYYGIGYKYYSIDSTGYYNVKNANDKFEMNYAERWGAVVRVTGTGFIAEGIDFVNTFNLYVCSEELGDSKVGNATEYGQSISGSLEERTSTSLDVHNTKNVERAAAMVLDGDNAEFKNCSFVSSQDTLYTGSKNSYFNNCTISGQTDYIFGNDGTKAIFDNCTLNWLGYTGTPKVGYITATRGAYIFRGCDITKSSEDGVSVAAGYYGRPWGADAAVYFIGSTIAEGAVNAAGWYEMNAKPQDVTFREYGNKVGDDFFKSSFVATYPAFSLSSTEVANLVDLSKDATFFGGWTPSYQVTSALDLSDLEGWDEEENEDPKPSTGATYILNASDVTALGANGTDNFFTIGENVVLEANTKKFTVGEETLTITNRLKSGNVAYAPARAIAFEVPEGYTATVIACAVSSNGSNNSAAGIYKGDATTPVESFDITAGTTPTLTFTTTFDAGQYYFGTGKTGGANPAAGANFYYLQVTLASTSAPSGAAPVVSSVTAELDAEKDDEIVASWTATEAGSGDGYFRVYVSKDGGDYTAIGDKLGLDVSSYNYKATASGRYTFKVVGGIGSDENEGTISEVVNYVLTLAKPVIKTAVAGDGTVTLTWNEVKEADKYVIAYSATDGSANGSQDVAAPATTVKLEGLTNGTYYEITLKAYRGVEEFTTSDVLRIAPFVAVDDSNAIPGMTIVNQNAANSAIAIRDGGNITISQPATSGGVASGKTTNESFLQWPTALTSDFTFTTKIKITSKSITGTSGGVFMGMFSGNGENDSLAALALRGDGSINNYRTKDNKSPIGTRGGSAFTMKWEVGKTYTLTVKRDGAKLIETISDDKSSESKEYDAKNAGAVADESQYVECTALTEGAPVYAAIALAGVTAEFNNITLIVPAESGDGVLFDSEKLDGSFSPFVDNWDKVPAPIIKSVTVDSKNGKITVVTESDINATGAGSVEVAMKDSADKVVSTKTSSAFGTKSQTFEFVPAASGSYTFVAESSRTGNSLKKTSAPVTAEDFVLPLAKANITSIYNGGVDSEGKGSIIVEWDVVPEALGYMVLVDGTVLCIHTDLDETSAVLNGYVVGSTHNVQIQAVRCNSELVVSDVGPISEKSTIVVTEEKQSKWTAVTYGTSTNTKSNGVLGSLNDGSVQVFSKDGAGKIVPGSCQDGLTFYYTTIDPENENFTMSAKIAVDSWTLSNGQEGFGVLMADTIGKNGDTAVVWNNSIMTAATKVEYYYDTVANAVTTDSTKSKITMKLGLGTIVRTGVTAADVEYNNTTGSFLYADGSEGAIPEGFSTKTYTLETSCANRGTGTYNIFGNATAPVDGTVSDIKEIYITVQRNNTGYFVRYTNATGDVLGETKIYDYDRNLLTMIDDQKIYIGFFASRNASVTVSDVTLETINPADDAPAEERPIEYVAPLARVESATFANASSYELQYYGNFDGRITIKQGNEVLVSGASVSALEKYNCLVTLTNGTNNFEIIATPNADFRPEGKDYMKLSSYDSITIKHSVLYKGYDNAILYVSPNGSALATGEKESPLDIYTAVKYVKPGQTIMLAGGTYKLSKTVKIERGINGQPGNEIVMMADPSAESRPVFDFSGKCAGMIMAGNYWIFKNFDVTNSANAQKGIQLSGSNNVLDDLNTYRNGNTGLQVSRYLVSDTFEDWPANNLIKNCTSYFNADAGYEDADGFAAKLTIGEGNVFDGCISAYNADDGWDLYAKTESGPIGKVVIRNSVAFMNGYILDAEGKLVNAGNGNGFKMGGESLSGHHALEGSIAFANKAKGIDSNSCPDISVKDCISFDNESYNIALYTNMAKNTDFSVDGLISYKKSNKVAEQLKLLGTQDNEKIYGVRNFYTTDANKSANSAGTLVADDWFVSLDTAKVLNAFKEYVFGDVTKTNLATVDGMGITRNENGSINMNGYLVLTEKGLLASGGNSAMTPSEEEEEARTLYRVVLNRGVSDEVVALINNNAVNKLTVNDAAGTAVDYANDIRDAAYSYAGMISYSTSSYVDIYSYKLQKFVDNAWVDLTAEEKGTNKSVDIVLPDEYRAWSDAIVVQMVLYSSGDVLTYECSGKNHGINTSEEIHVDTYAICGIIAIMKSESQFEGIEIKPWWGDITEEDLEVYGIHEMADIPNGVWVAGVPSEVTYTGKAINPAIRVYDGNRMLNKGKEYTVEYKRTINAAGISNVDTAPTITIKGKGIYKNQTVKKYFTILPVDIATDNRISADDIVRTYDKNAKKPVPKLMFGTKALSTKTDYTVEYVDSNTETAKAYVDNGTWSIKLVGKNKNFTGERIVTLTVTDQILMTKVSVKKIADQHYTGTEMTPDIKITYTKSNKTVTLNGVEASAYNAMTSQEEKAAIDYIYTYSNNLAVGTAKVEITGVNKYTGTVTKTFKILGNKLSASANKISGIKSSIRYTGTAIEQDVKINSSAYKYSYNAEGILQKAKAGVLVGVSEAEFDAMSEEEQAEVDYTIGYLNNLNIGKATAVLTGRNHFYGTVKKTFNITGISMSKVAAVAIPSVNYAGYAQTPSVKLTYTTGSGASKVVTPLVENVDYKVVYKNNYNAGKASAVVTGIGLYSGKKTLSFTIKPVDLKAGFTEGGATVINPGEIYWVKKNYVSAIPYVGYLGNELTQGKDYKVSFANIDTVRPIESGKAAKMTIKGVGNYTGSITMKVSVNKIEFQNEFVSSNCLDVKAGASYKPTSLKVYLDEEFEDGSIKKHELKKDRDYKILDYIYASDCDVIVDGKTVKKYWGDVIEKNDVIPAGTELGVLLEGIGNYTGSFYFTYVVCDVLLNDVSIKVDKPSVEITPDADVNIISVESLNIRYVEDGVTYNYVDGEELALSDYTNSKSLSTSKKKASAVLTVENHEMTFVSDSGAKTLYVGGTRKVTYSVIKRLFEIFYVS